MEETRLILNTSDGKRIYGALNQPSAKQADALVILMAGLGRNTLYDALHVEARRYFNDLGYDVCRFNFYDARYGARQLHETTLQTHLDDLTQILSEIGSGYNKVFICGHSYGGMLTMIKNAGLDFDNIKGQALWDGGHGLGDRLAVIDGRMAKPFPEYNLVGYDYGVKLMVSADSMEERKIFTVDYCNTLAKNCVTPTLVTAASESFLVEGARDYFEHLTVDKEYVEISGAAHFFAEGDTALALYAATHDFFKQYLDNGDAN